MTTSDRALKEEASASSQGDAAAIEGSFDESMARLGRIGRKLFGVMNCIITFGDALQKRRDADQSTALPEEVLCSNAALAGEPVIVLDAKNHHSCRQNQVVAGASHMRFFASYPVFNQEKTLVGCVSLLDPVPRVVFDEDDRRALADLAALVERELELRSANALQLDLQKKKQESASQVLDRSLDRNLESRRNHAHPDDRSGTLRQDWSAAVLDCGRPGLLQEDQ
jgi:GAF domain-containing protein